MGKTRKIDWLNHGLEFAVVVVGILIAFQLNTCREDSKEKALVNQHKSNVMDEVKFNLYNIENAITDLENTEKSIDTLLQTISAGKDTLGMNNLSMQILNIRGAYIKRNAYTSFVESGDIRLEENFDFRDRLISLYEYYNWADGYRDAANEFFFDTAFPYMIDNFDMVTMQPQGRDTYDSRKYMNALSSYKYQLIAMTLKYKEVKELNQKFIESFDTP
ncbi:MAG: hypothetical protein AAFP76_09740 [Bacteroidota bacterium]